MNFTKYASALALFATAAYATDGPVTTQPNADVSNAVKFFKECKTAENNTKPAFLQCMIAKGIEEKLAAKLCSTYSEADSIDEDKVKASIQTINSEIAEANSQNNKKEGEGHWYDAVNNWYGYTAVSVIVLIVVGGGVYMAVGRKSDGADL